jgi:ribosome-interacting GTPase 1
MPANLTPDYMAADKKFKEATTPQAKLEALEEMLATIPKHKGTEKMQANLKSRIAKLRQEAQKRKGSARARPFYHVEREGAGQIVLIGAPNTGKSALLGALTNAEPEVANYPFTTRTPMTGMAAFEDIQIQLVDLPPISEESAEGWLYGIIRSADGAFVIVDLSDEDLLSATEHVFELLTAAGVTLIPPDRSRGPNEVPAVFVATKADAPHAAVNLGVFKEFYGGRLPIVVVSAEQDMNLDALRRQAFEMLKIIRVYSKKPGKKADLNVPFVLRRGTTVLEAAAVVHKDFASNLKYARLWRRPDIDGLMASRDQILQDADILELHT